MSCILKKNGGKKCSEVWMIEPDKLAIVDDWLGFRWRVVEMWMKWAINVDNMRYKLEFSENMWM